MGSSESQPVRNMDKRTCRREYRDDFENAISKIRKAYQGDPEYSNANASSSGSGGGLLRWDNGNIRVCIRKRPIFPRELQGGEFDVAYCPPSKKKIIIHDARMHSDMKRQYINNIEFDFDRVFDESSSNRDVYAVAAAPLVEIAYNGGYATCMVYGQTGSGKTFTMTSIYEEAARDIFRLAHENTKRFASEPEISVSFFEIAGDTVSDLLGSYKETKLVSGVDGSVHPFPVVEVPVRDASELVAMIMFARNIRTTAATGVHDASSRSHAVLRIYIQRTMEEANSGNSSTKGGISDLRLNNDDSNSNCIEGSLTLVDLAGSEHRIDSMYHNADRRKETSMINSSLMALKDCIRSKFSGSDSSHIYRRSKLTMALKGAFTIPEARTVVIATVSPSSKDTEHSLNTIRHACMMDGQQETIDASETRFQTGGKVTTIEMGAIDISGLVRKAKSEIKQTGEVHSLKTSNGNVIKDFVELTEKEKLRLRRQAEKRAFGGLEQNCKDILSSARKNMHHNSRQYRRMRVAMQELMALRLQQQEEEEAKNAASIVNSNDNNDEDEDDEAELPDRNSNSNNIDSNHLDFSNLQKSPRTNAVKRNSRPSSSSSKSNDIPTLLKSDSKMILFSENENVADLFSNKTTSNATNRDVDSKSRRREKGQTSSSDTLNSDKLNIQALEQALNGVCLEQSNQHRGGGVGRKNTERKAQSQMDIVNSPPAIRAPSPIKVTPAREEPPPPLDKHAAAKARRDKLINEQKQSLVSKLQEKGNVSTNNYNKSDIDELESLVFKLEEQLQDPSLSKVTIHGINQQLLKHKATILREKNNYAQKYKRNDLKSDEGLSDIPIPVGNFGSPAGLRNGGGGGGGSNHQSPGSPIPPPPPSMPPNYYNNSHNSGYNNYGDFNGNNFNNFRGGRGGGEGYDDNSYNQYQQAKNRDNSFGINSYNNSNNNSMQQNNNRNDSRHLNNNNSNNNSNSNNSSSSGNTYQPDFNNRPSVRSNPTITNTIAGSGGGRGSMMHHRSDDEDADTIEDPFIASLRNGDSNYSSKSSNNSKFAAKPAKLSSNSSNNAIGNKNNSQYQAQQQPQYRGGDMNNNNNLNAHGYSNSNNNSNNNNNSATQARERDGAGNYVQNHYNQEKYQNQQSQYAAPAPGPSRNLNPNNNNNNNNPNNNNNTSSNYMRGNNSSSSSYLDGDGRQSSFNNEQFLVRSSSAHQFSASTAINSSSSMVNASNQPQFASSFQSQAIAGGRVVRGRGQWSSVGAAAAPFGNAYND